MYIIIFFIIDICILPDNTWLFNGCKTFMIICPLSEPLLFLQKIHIIESDIANKYIVLTVSESGKSKTKLLI